LLPVPRIRPINAGRGNEDDPVDAEGRGGFKHLEGAAHIEVEEIVRIFLTVGFVDAVPGGDVNDAIAAAEYFCQIRPVENGPVEKHCVLVQIPWSANVQNHRHIAPSEQDGHEGLAEIPGPSCQKHLHRHLPFLLGDRHARWTVLSA
jgi:hypothetical protein